MAAADAEGFQGDGDGIGAVGAAHGVRYAAVIGPGFLELRYGCTADKPACGDLLFDIRHEAVFVVREPVGEVHQWYRHFMSIYSPV